VESAEAIDMKEFVRLSFWAHLGSIRLFWGLPCSRIVRAELIFDASLFPTWYGADKKKRG
jgi:hypothetical protein